MHRGQRPQLREQHGVVAAEADRRDAGARDLLERSRRARERVDRRPGHGRHVAPVDDREPLDDVHAQQRVVVPQDHGDAADRLRPEAGAGSVHDRVVRRDADDGDVDALQVANVREPHERPRAREARHLERVGRPVARHRGAILGRWRRPPRASPPARPAIVCPAARERRPRRVSPVRAPRRSRPRARPRRVPPRARPRPRREAGAPRRGAPRRARASSGAPRSARAAG